jgi:hypothetical protein
VTTDLYARIYFVKGSSSTTYSRAYYKVDEFFSYVGGLVGVIMGGMLLLTSYNQSSFEFSLAKDLFRKKADSSLARFNLIYYVMLLLHSALKAVSSKCRAWSSIGQFEEAKEEMAKQLDISLILRRILFLERSVQTLFEGGQFEAMHLTQKPTLE